MLLMLLAGNGYTLAGNWQRNTYPGQGFVDHGQPAGAGWDHSQTPQDLAVSPLDPNLQIFLDNQWSMVLTRNGRDFLPLGMPYIGSESCKGQSVKFSRYDLSTIYLTVMSDYWTNRLKWSPVGLWRSPDLGATWVQLYQLPAGSYARKSNLTGKNYVVEDPTPS